MKKRKTAKFRVALGQVGLLISILLFALLLGLVPDRKGAVRQGRAALAESVAINVSGHVMRSTSEQMIADLQLVVERNPDLLSAAIRQNGKEPIEIGDHGAWTEMEGEFSSDSQVLVPLFSGERRWGQLELRFDATTSLMGWDVSQYQMMPLLGFLSLSSFVVFYLYLGKMLKHLDPSRAIPQRVRSALDTMAEGLLVIDIKGQIVLANGAIAEILGKNVDELLGWKTSDIGWDLGEDQHAGELAPWEICLNTGTPQRNSVVKLRDEFGDDRTFIVNCSPVMATGGKHGGALISFDDVTLLEEKKRELEIAMEAAEAANQSKSEFLANMSHEIRTPMNAILGFTDILRRGYGTSNQDPREYLNTIHSSGQHLLDLINDILDLSKVESGRLEVESIQCSPHIIIKEVIQVLAAKANEKGIDLSAEVEGKIPETILSDPARLRQIATNLVGNAIKFTSKGAVTVTMSVLNDSSSPIMKIDIRDTGIGMSPEQMQKIFDPFSQADSSVTRKFGGTGLGLAISRRFAEAMDGSITVDSVPGRGSVFTLNLQTGLLDGVKLLGSECLDSMDAQHTERVACWKFKQQKVLVVDDGKENRELARLVLEEANLKVTCAENGKIGVDLALANHFDLILMDMQMPVMDGYAATRLLREQGMELPIYALTAHAMSGFEKECLDAGCSGFLTKPINIDRLLGTIGDILDGEASTAELAKHVAPPNSTEANIRLEAENDQEQVQPLVSRLPMDQASFRQIVIEFVPRVVEQLERMCVAYEAKDFEALYELAHWLKGAGGTVGFPQFTEPAAELEQLAKQNESSQKTVNAIIRLRDLAARIQIPSIEKTIPISIGATSQTNTSIQEVNY